MPAKLLIPGPVAVEEETLREMGGPAQVHHGAEWTATYNETREVLQRVFRVGHFGPMVAEADLDEVLVGLAGFLAGR